MVYSILTLVVWGEQKSGKSGYLFVYFEVLYQIIFPVITGPGHPMKPHRLSLTHNLVLNYGLYKKMQVSMHAEN